MNHCAVERSHISPHSDIIVINDIKCFANSSWALSRRREAIGAIFHMAKRKSGEWTVHQINPTNAPSHTRYFSMLWTPDEPRAHYRQIQRLRSRSSPNDPFLPNFRDGVSSHIINIFQKWSFFAHYTVCRRPIVNDKTAHMNEPLHRAFCHSVKKSFCGDDTGCELIFFTTTCCGRQVNHGIDVGKSRYERVVNTQISAEYLNLPCPLEVRSSLA